MKRKLIDPDTPSSTVSTPIKVKEEDGLSFHELQDGKKKGSASRTGTACDRCRVRKMRCDDNPDGCASCRQAQTECKTTDRITGKATGRGYVDTLEGRLAELEQRNHELQAQVAALGGQARPPPANVDPMLDHIPLPTNGLRREDTDSSCSRQPSDQPPILDGRDHRRKGLGRDGRNMLPPSRKGLYGNNYFGISSGNNLISSVRATSMNVLGMEIDLTDYLSPDVDEPDPSQGDQRIYNKSYRAFVQTAFGMGPRLQKVELPARSEAFHHAQIFLRVTAAFVPIVHAPSFMSLLTRFYDDPKFEPTVAEIAQVHAALAIAYCQFASRGTTDPDHQREINTASNFHYHYALSFFAQLMASHTLADVQALGLLCIHLRNCPKPGAAWMLTSIVLDLAIELGLHRSARNWPSSVKRNVLEIEMRKRVFWSINWIHVLVGGSLGRPMALQAGDWDVEVPEAVDDDLLTEEGIETAKPGNCTFLAAIENFKILPIYMDLYNIIYAVGTTPPNYEETVKGLEARLQEWQDRWPPELKHNGPYPEMSMIQVHYLHMWKCHVQLLLRHPSLAPPTSPQFSTESLTKCLGAARDLLSHVKELQANRGLDITWQTSALFVLAIATTLYGNWERKSRLNVHNFGKLKQDMQDWLCIMSDMDTLLGAHGKLVQNIRTIIDTTLTSLSQSMLTNATAPSHQQQVTSMPAQNSPRGAPNTSNTEYRPSPQHQHGFPSPNNEATVKAENAYVFQGGNVPTIPHRPQQYHQHAPQHEYAQNYPGPPESNLNASTYVNSFSQPNYPPSFTPQSSAPTPDLPQAPGSPSSWRHFTGNMIPQWGSSTDYLSSASALMQLGGGNGGNETSHQQQPQQHQQHQHQQREMMTVPNAEQRLNNVYGDAQMWPMIWFEQPPNVSGL